MNTEGNEITEALRTTVSKRGKSFRNYRLVDFRRVLERRPERVGLVTGIDEHRFNGDVGRGQQHRLAKFERHLAREAFDGIEQPVAAIARRAQHLLVRFQHVGKGVEKVLRHLNQ